MVFLRDFPGRQILSPSFLLSTRSSINLLTSVCRVPRPPTCVCGPANTPSCVLADHSWSGLGGPDTDADTTHPQRPPGQDLCNALGERLQVLLLFCRRLAQRMLNICVVFLKLVFGGGHSVTGRSLLLLTINRKCSIAGS